MVNLKVYASGGIMGTIFLTLDEQLFASMIRNHAVSAELLIRQGANPHMTDEQGRTLLHQAAYDGNIENMRWLLEQYNFSLDAQDYYGNTPAHLAAMNGHEGAIRWLREHGADLTIKNIDGAIATDMLLI
jgi:ankyrin repeat protein